MHMIKIGTLALLFLALSGTARKCGQKKEALAAGCYKGRLEVKGGCMNYTISILAGNYPEDWVIPSWTDEQTGKNYKHVFALGSRCSFPSSIEQGQEFYFRIDSTTATNC